MFTLTGTLHDHAGEPLAGSRVQIMPSPSVTVDHDGDVVHLGGTDVVTDEAGSFTVSLVHGPDLTYLVRGTAGGKLRPVRFSCDDIADGATIDLADVTPAPAVGLTLAAIADVWSTRREEAVEQSTKVAEAIGSTGTALS